MAGWSSKPVLSYEVPWRQGLQAVAAHPPGFSPFSRDLYRNLTSCFARVVAAFAGKPWKSRYLSFPGLCICLNGYSAEIPCSSVCQAEGPVGVSSWGDLLHKLVFQGNKTPNRRWLIFRHVIIVWGFRSEVNKLQLKNQF